MIKGKTDKKSVQEFAVNNFAPIFNKQLEENGGEFIVGKKITWLDFLLADAIDGIFERIKPQNLEIFKKLEIHRDRIFETKNDDGSLRLIKTIQKRRDFDENLQE
uniref:GST C-terminal domain-containing protein n=1 Tax=Panagrolaimus superbus TaxID=310955 RepID=A0A914ZA45_9BILA